MCLVFIFAGALVNALGAIVLGAPVGISYVMVACTEFLILLLFTILKVNLCCGWIKWLIYEILEYLTSPPMISQLLLVSFLWFMDKSLLYDCLEFEKHSYRALSVLCGSVCGTENEWYGVFKFFGLNGDN